MYHKKSFYYSSAHNAWLSVIAIKTGKQHQISLELEKQDFWQVPAAAATSATSAARLRLVLTSCRQGRLTGLGLLTLQKRWSTKLQSHLKNSNNVKTASQKNLWYDHTYLHKLFIPGHYVWSFCQYVKESKIISIFSPSPSLDDLTYFLQRFCKEFEKN